MSAIDLSVLGAVKADPSVLPAAPVAKAELVSWAEGGKVNMAYRNGSFKFLGAFESEEWALLTGASLSPEALPTVVKWASSQGAILADLSRFARAAKSLKEAPVEARLIKAEAEEKAKREAEAKAKAERDAERLAEQKKWEQFMAQQNAMLAAVVGALKKK